MIPFIQCTIVYPTITVFGTGWLGCFNTPLHTCPITLLYKIPMSMFIIESPAPSSCLSLGPPPGRHPCPLGGCSGPPQDSTDAVLFSLVRVGLSLALGLSWGWVCASSPVPFPELSTVPCNITISREQSEELTARQRARHLLLKPHEGPKWALFLPPFPNEKIGTQRGQVTCPRPHS